MRLSIFNNTKVVVIVLWVCVAGVYCLSSTAREMPEPAVLADPPSSGAEIFAANCAKCHGMDGRAKTAKGRRAGATDFTSDWNRDEARGIRIITNGKGNMPSFKGKLSPGEIRSVFGYVSRFGR